MDEENIVFFLYICLVDTDSAQLLSCIRLSNKLIYIYNLL